jgi:hypothetical protein
MKTTVEISDPLLQQARQIAARDGVTLRELIESGLREILAKRKTHKPFKLKDGSFKGGKGLHPEAEALGWERIREMAYEGRGG